MKKIRIEGDGTDKKFRHVEKYLESFQRRLQKTSAAIIPPIPIFGYAEVPAEDGIIYRAVIPAPGYLSRMCLSVKEYSLEHTKAVKFYCGVTRASGMISHTLETRRAITVEEIGVDVETGDALEISVEDASLVKGIGISLLYHIGISESAIHNVLIEELDRVALEE